MEDRELIRRIQGGQTEYLNDVAARYYDDIYYFCCYQTGDRDGAYDLTQETFLRFIRYVDHYKYHNLKGYLLTIAMNVCRASWRNEADRESVLRAAREEQHRSAGSSEADNIRAVLLKEALAELTESQREAVILHHLYGYKNREIARMTGASLAAVKSRIRQGVEKLQLFLEKEDFYGGI